MPWEDRALLGRGGWEGGRETGTLRELERALLIGRDSVCVCVCVCVCVWAGTMYE